MKILYHHRTQAEDAQGIHIQEMINAFRRLGHEANIIALVESSPPVNSEKSPNDRWQWLTSRAPNWLYELSSLAYNLYGYVKLVRAIRETRPDFIYERYSLNTFCGVWAARRFNIPLILEVNSPLYLEQKALGKLTFNRLAKFSERWICSHSTTTIVVSQVMKNLLLEEGVAGQKIVVMHNGINPSEFHPDVAAKIVRDRYKLHKDIVVGFVGWFRKWHGLDMLLEEMHGAHLFDKGIKLILVGDGPAYPELYHYVQEHNLLSSVIFTGPVVRSEIPSHIAAMDIAVQPSVTQYASPMKIIEYMAMGKCIIAPDQANIRELLKNEVNCLLFRKQDKSHLKRALSKAIEDREKRLAYGKVAYQTIVDRRMFWSENARKTLELVLGTKEVGTES